MSEKRLPGRISASIMCGDFLHMEECLSQLECAGIEMLHLDIMDGRFVPNITLGTCVIDQIRRKTKIPFDYHLMIERPEEKLGYFDIRPGDYVSVHCESTCHLQRILQRIKAMGAHPGAALNPATPMTFAYEVLEDVDYILIMTVNPGFSGQKMIPHTLKKIREAEQYLSDNGYPETEIQVDGNVDFANARKMREAGAGIFVAGSSGLFVKGMEFQESAELLRRCIE